MNILIDKHKDFLFDLLKENVDFILVGGYAVIYHGYLRTTGDLDIWLKPTNENKLKLLSVLEKNNFEKESITKLSNLDFIETIAFHFGKPPERIDFMTKLTGLDFDKAYEHKIGMEVRNFTVPILHLDDLILNKMLTVRLKDKADVEELQKILRRKK